MWEPSDAEPPTGGTVTKLQFAWGHVELLQEVLSISRMHLTEGDIP